MNHNPARLPLLLEIGFVASQARFTDWLDKNHPITLQEEDDPHDFPIYFLATDLWNKAEELVRRLVCMDLTSRFTPGCNSMLQEYGLLEHYREVRYHLDEDEDIPFNPWPGLPDYPYPWTEK